MVLIDFPNKFKVEVETKQRDIEKIEDELTQIRKKQLEKEAEKETEEYKEKRKAEKEAYRRKWILEFFKELNPEHREMTEEEYKVYTSIIDDKETKKGYSILSFINKESTRNLPQESEIKKFDLTEEIPELKDNEETQTTEEVQGVRETPETNE